MGREYAMKAFVKGTNIEVTIKQFNVETNGRAAFSWCDCIIEGDETLTPVPAADIELRE